MAGKIDTDVVIGGKMYTISGYESKEYLQKVATYIDTKLAQFSNEDSYKRLPLELQNVLLQINIADEYLNACRQISKLEEKISSNEKNIYDLKHELVAAKMKLDSYDKTIKSLQTKLSDSEKEIVRLETKLKGQ